MQSLSQLAAIVKNASNMVEVEAAILTEVFNRHSCTYAKHVCRPGGVINQKAWVNEVCSNMAELIKYDQSYLFSLVPPRFFTTHIYNRLKNRIAI